MFYRPPRFQSRLANACQDIGAGKEGRSRCSPRPSVLTRPRPEGDLARMRHSGKADVCLVVRGRCRYAQLSLVLLP
jgi:hypothetical protein